MSLDIIAGPYELFHEQKKKDKVTIAIMDNNEVSWRFYRGPTVMRREARKCTDFDQAMGELESKLSEFKGLNYLEQEELDKKKKEPKI